MLPASLETTFSSLGLCDGFVGDEVAGKIIPQTNWYPVATDGGRARMPGQAR
jgi:hypothetical protein